MNLNFLKIKKFKIDFFKLINYSTLFVILSVLGYLGYFIYFILYQTVIQAGEVVVLKQEVAPDALDNQKISKTLLNYEDRLKISQEFDPNKIKDIFSINPKNNPTEPAAPIQTPGSNEIVP